MAWSNYHTIVKKKNQLIVLINEAGVLINRFNLKVNSLRETWNEIRNNNQVSEEDFWQSTQQHLNLLNNSYDKYLERINEIENEYHQLMELINFFLRPQDDYTYDDEVSEQLEVLNIRGEILTSWENIRQRKIEAYASFTNFRNNLIPNLPPGVE